MGAEIADRGLALVEGSDLAGDRGNGDAAGGGVGARQVEKLARRPAADRVGGAGSEIGDDDGRRQLRAGAHLVLDRQYKQLRHHHDLKRDVVEEERHVGVAVRPRLEDERVLAGHDHEAQNAVGMDFLVSHLLLRADYLPVEQHRVVDRVALKGRAALVSPGKRGDAHLSVRKHLRLVRGLGYRCAVGPVDEGPGKVWLVSAIGIEGLSSRPADGG